MFRCATCTEKHIEKAFNAGASRKEVAETVLIASVEGAGDEDADSRRTGNALSKRQVHGGYPQVDAAGNVGAQKHLMSYTSAVAEELLGVLGGSQESLGVPLTADLSRPAGRSAEVWPDSWKRSVR